MLGNKSAETRHEMRERIRSRKNRPLATAWPPPGDIPQVGRGQYNRDDEGDDSPEQEKQLTM